MHGDATQYKILEPVCKRCWRIDDPEALPDIMDKAFRMAESGRPGPVLIDMPMDMFSREVEEDLWERTKHDCHFTCKPALLPDAAKTIAKRLVEAIMENIVVPTPGCWNINDIYSPGELVAEGKLVKKENGKYVTPSHAKSHRAK